MPNLGAGVDNHVNLTPTVTLVFTPNPSAATPTVRFFNEGSNPVYVGGLGVTQYNGLKLMPNCKVELSNINANMYAGGAFVPTTVGTTAAAITAGNTIITCSTTSFPVGTWVAVGTGAVEAVQVTTLGTTTLGLASALAYDHAQGATVVTCTPTIGQLRVTAGT